ncbi:MAG: TlpA family protein disulfide reductase [Proteobacteria bacterium]|nr:TlpA family protein disulfide reductase [Pseudomonadota bacterium]HQR03933.1 TlpA disulfide reductase family protein [Rhodocyclaceae bacterium]
MKKIAAILILAALAVAGWLWLGQEPAAPQARITLLDGKTSSLSAWRGKVVLVNFWATTCTTCVSEMPRLTAIYRKYAPQGYDMVAVAMDYDPPGYVQTFVQEKRLPFTVARDDKGEVAQAFGGVRLTPTSFLIDRQGRIVQQYLGAPDFDKFEQTVARLLRASA